MLKTKKTKNKLKLKDFKVEKIEKKQLSGLTGGADEYSKSDITGSTIDYRNGDCWTTHSGTFC